MAHRILNVDGIFFYHQDWTYRDIVQAEQSYSQKQRDYFSTPPAQRILLLRNWGFLPKEEDGGEQTPDSEILLNGHG